MEATVKLTRDKQLAQCEKQLMDLQIDRLNTSDPKMIASIDHTIVGLKASIEVLKALETHKF